MNIKKKDIAGRWKRATGHCALLNMSIKKKIAVALISHSCLLGRCLMPGLRCHFISMLCESPTKLEVMSYP